MKDFTVSANTVKEFDKLKQRAESLGWKYNSSIVPYEDACNYIIKYLDSGCLWFRIVKGEKVFSLADNVDESDFLIEKDWSIIVRILSASKTHVTLQEIADWKGVSINDLTIGL